MSHPLFTVVATAEATETAEGDVDLTVTESEPRSYVMGLPVTITIESDGSVSYSVDLSEAGRRRDLYDAQEGIEEEYQYSDDQIDADAKIIDAATDRLVANKGTCWTGPHPIG